MIAKKTLFTYLAITCSGMILTMHAENSAQETNQSTITLTKSVRTNPIKRPKAPDRQIVTCTYDGEELNLNFVIPEGMATLSCTDETLLTATFEFDSTPLQVSIPVGKLWGTVSIELETANGNTYTGSL